MKTRPEYSELVAQADKAAGAVTDPELKRIAFEKVLDDLRASTNTTLFDSVSKLIQVLSVVIGVLISVLSFNAVRQAEAEARTSESKKYEDQRKDEAYRKETEAAKPFLELRQKVYMEAVHAACVLANPEEHIDDVKAARIKFRDLYVAELSMVENIDVEEKMMSLARAVDPKLRDMTKEQIAAYELAHALRDSLRKSWGLNQDLVDNPD